MIQGESDGELSPEQVVTLITGAKNSLFEGYSGQRPKWNEKQPCTHLREEKSKPKDQ